MAGRTTRVGLCALVAMGSLAAGPGCGSEESKVTVNMQVSMLAAELDGFREAIVPAFQEAHPEVVLQVSGAQYKDILANVNAGQEIDLYESDVVMNVGFPEALASGRIADLTERVSPYLARENEPGLTAAFNRSKLDGKYYLAPFRSSWNALVVDQAAVATPPQTWDELKAAVDALPSGKSFTLNLKAYEGLTCQLLPFVWSAGGCATRFDAKAEQALSFLDSLTMASFASTMDEGKTLEKQSAGELAMHQNWPFVVASLKTEGKWGPGKNTVVPTPKASGGVSVGTVGGGLLAVNGASSPEKRDAAWKFIEWINSPEGEVAMFHALGAFPFRGAARTALGAEVSDYQGYLAMAETVRSRPMCMKWDEVSALWQQAFLAVKGGTKTVQQAVADAQAAFDAIPGNDCADVCE